MAFGRDQGKCLHMIEDFLEHDCSFFVEKEMEFDEYQKLDKKFKNNYFILKLKN